MAKKKKVELDESGGINDTIAKIEQQFGAGAIMMLDNDDYANKNIEAISTGSLSLDIALGIGGYARGRILELYGPESAGKTTLALHMIAEAQKAGGRVAFIDAEHALDVEYAKRLGIDPAKILISQPDNGEQALEITETLARSGQIDVIVIDSVAALTPRAEIEGEMGDSHMGLQARLMSQALRKLTGVTSNTGTTIIFINQIRHKIGVMFGCLHYNARVLLADGTTEKIGKIVNNKLELEIMTFNKRLKKLEPKKIVNWFDNGKASKLWQVVVKNPHGSGRSNIPVADDHVFSTPDGDRKLSELVVGDAVHVKTTKYLNEDQRSLALGMFLGDSSLRTSNNQTFSLRTKHGIKQSNYCEWKRNKFPDSFVSSEGYDKENRFWFDLKSTTEFSNISLCKEGSALRTADAVLSGLDKLAVAIWYLDDGNFSGSYKFWGKGKSRIYCTKLPFEDKKMIAHKFVEIGLPFPSIDEKGFIFYGKQSYKFQEAIAKYVPKVMVYKIHPKLRYLCEAHILMPKNEMYETVTPTPILDIYEKIDPKQMKKFDIEVEDNHNYFVDNVLVHNSPETTCGGNALKFYASMRLEIRKSTVIKNGDDIIGNLTKVKVVKNKVAPPFKKVTFDIIYGEGISLTGEIVDLGVESGVISKGGAWYAYNGENIGQGREKTKAYLEENPEIAEEIKGKVYAFFGIGDAVLTETTSDTEDKTKEEVAKYHEQGKCPRCNAMLLDASSSYPEAIFKDKLVCKECSRIWLITDEGRYERFQ